MNMDKTPNKTTFTIGCMPWSGVVLTIAIMLIRAFQPGAEPIESWSILSWCLMLFPAFVTLMFGLGCVLLWAIAMIFVDIFDK